MADDGFDFSPLTPEEREAGQETAPGGEPDADKPTLPPADAEPAETAAARLFRHPPDAIWRYATAEGETAFFVCRYNKPDGRKDFLPLCWFPGDGWRSKHWPAPRPLYNLDKLDANPGAPVIVCEGEKSADAAARIFPNSTVTTSCGGSGAARLSDWTPLAGRSVLIWRDNDEPGATYERGVATELTDLSCDVAIVDVAALVQIDGGARGPDFDPIGWDAANAINEWKDRDSLRKAIVGLAKPFHPGPAYVSFGPYTMTASGLTVEIVCGRGAVKWMETVSLAAPFEVVGLCRDPHGQGWGKMRWRDADGAEHDRYVGDAAMHGDPAALCAGLADGGLRINRAHQRQFAHYLSQAQVKRRVTVVSRTGWHEISGQAVFVLPGNTIGPRRGERVILNAAACGHYEAHGSLDDWRDGAAKLASGHVLAVLAISTALAGTLAHLAGYEGGGLHFVGPSSIGKTTLLRLAASVWGPPGFLRAWRATVNGLEGAAVSATDTVLILDELGQVEPRELAAALYMIPNETGKARANRDGSLREPRTWRLMFLSSGEVPIEAKLAEDRGRKSRAGQLVRMLDIRAERACGVLDHAGPDGDAAALAKACKLAAAAAYGTAGPEFVRRLILDDVSGEDVRALVKEFAASHVPPCAEP